MMIERKSVYINHQWKCPICGSRDLWKNQLIDSLRGPVCLEEDLFYECGNCSIVFRDYKKFVEKKELKKEERRNKCTEKDDKEILIECRCMHCGRKKKQWLKKDSPIYLYQKYRDEKRKIDYCIDTCYNCRCF